MKIAVLVPCYNEEAAIAKVVADFRAALPDSVVYVYDNNSTDRTVEVAAAAGAVMAMVEIAALVSKRPTVKAVTLIALSLGRRPRSSDVRRVAGHAMRCINTGRSILGQRRWREGIAALVNLRGRPCFSSSQIPS